MKRSFKFLLMLILFYIFFEISHLHFTTIDGYSMAPRFLPGDRAVYTTNPFWSYKDDDVVIATIWKNEGPLRLIKRAVKVGPGELELFRTNENGEKEYKTFKVQKGCVFLMGDNSLNSTDSRDFGPIPVGWLNGIVVMKWHGLDWFPI